MKKLSSILFVALASCYALSAQILPKPVSITESAGSFSISDLSTISVNDGGEFTSEVFMLQQAVKDATGRFLSTATADHASLVITKSVLENLPDNAYMLDVSPEGIRLQSPTSEGLFYGIQTIRQLIENAEEGKIASVKVTDYPAYPWRGLMLDVSRHFYPIEYLKQQIRILSYYKLNKFHLHLTDDEGWRIEIKSYPELTLKTAWRDLDRRDKMLLRPGRNTLDRNLVQVDTAGNMRYGGYYTQQQIKDLVAYAAAYHVDIVPEIDMPGHMMAAVQTYPEFTAAGKPSWGALFSSPLDPSSEKVLTFVKAVWDEILELFPSEYIHIGADEVDKSTWKESESCRKLMEENNLSDVNKLQSWFVEYVSDYIKSKGRKVELWDDALEGGISKDIQVLYWRDWLAYVPSEAVSKGHHVIFCPGTPMYLSRPSSAMYDIYHLRSFYDRSLNSDNLIRGAQCCVWGEMVGNWDWANSLIWPRMMATAELTWTPDAERNWEDFKRRATVQKKYLQDVEGMTLLDESAQLTVFQTTDTKAKAVRFHFETEKVDPELRYTLDGSEPSASSKVFTDNLPVKGPAVLSVGIVEDGKLLKPFFQRPVDYHKAVGKPVKYLKPWNKAYPAAGEASLTNAQQGADYYKDINWQGFTNDMEVVIDMEKSETIREVSVRFIEIAREDVYMPGSLLVSVSDDGEKFTQVAEVSNGDEKQQPRLKTFKAPLTNVKSRYIKVQATNVHPKMFIFADEIIVH